jgi:PAS domain-containing protein
MITQAATAPQRYPSNLTRSHVTWILSGRDECATLIADDLGRICGCGSAVEDIFGASRNRLLGRRTSEFIAGLFRDGISPNDNAKYLAHLCAGSQWRQFAATDARGYEFAVEIRVSRRIAEGKGFLFLDLRRPPEPT